jgi:hypothetical protein
MTIVRRAGIIGRPGTKLCRAKRALRAVSVLTTSFT